MLRKTRKTNSVKHNYISLLSLDQVDLELSNNIEKQMKRRGKVFGQGKTLMLPENNQIDGGDMINVSSGRVFE